MSNKMVIPYFTGETATAWCDSIGDYEEGQSTITNKQLRNLSEEALDVNPKDDELDISELILDEIGLLFDRIAVVDSKHHAFLANLSERAIQDNSDDSSWYEACEEYNDVMVGLADFTLPI